MVKFNARLVAVVGATIVALVAAGIGPAAAGILDDVQGQYDSATQIWLVSSAQYASIIYFGLVGTELAWSSLESVIKTGDLEGLVRSLIMRIIWVGVGEYALQQAPAFVNAFVTDMANIGATIASATGYPTTTPDGLLAVGWQICTGIWNASNNDNWAAQAAEVIPQTAASLLVEVGFGLAAAQLLLQKIILDFVVGAGAFLVGFIGSRWTLPYAEVYPRMIFRGAMGVFTIIVVAGLGAALGPRWIALANTTGTTAQNWIALAVSCGIFGLISWSLPSLIQEMSSASPVLSAAAIVQGVSGAVQGAASGAARAMGAGGGGGGSSNGAIAAIEKATGN